VSEGLNPVAAATQAAFLRACRLDVAVRKPGNVSVASPGHRMTAEQFIASAHAAAAALCQPGAPVGERIEGAMRATWNAVGCNTNLGILLLCAPLAAAAEAVPPGADEMAFRPALKQVLAGLDLADAQAAFTAIALASPGGLGQAPQQDVRKPPSVNLRDAMALSAPRDRIAWQYVHDHADLFGIGLPALGTARTALHAMPPDGVPSPELEAAVLRVYLGFLGAFADSHIVRKRGDALAQTVMHDTRAHAATLQSDHAAVAAWDERLKADGINPGTSADLTVACLMLAGLLAAGSAG